VLFRMTLSDLEWLSETFNDTKLRAASLRQLSYFWTRLLTTKSRADWQMADCSKVGLRQQKRPIANGCMQYATCMQRRVGVVLKWHGKRRMSCRLWGPYIVALRRADS